MKRKKYFKRRDLSKRLKKTLCSAKGYEGEYEYDEYEKLLEKLRDTNPFSVLVFYEQGKRLGLGKKKKLNPDMPERILTADSSRYSQFYFIPETNEMRIGNYWGSGYRNVQSLYIRTLAEISKKRDIPTHILVKEAGHEVRHVLSSRTLVVQPHEIMQTLHDRAYASEILKNIRTAYVSRNIENCDLIDYIFTSQGMP